MCVPHEIVILVICPTNAYMCSTTVIWKNIHHSVISNNWNQMKYPSLVQMGKKLIV